ncbi:MAG: serine/threonine protein kinase, partial [Acidobacteria bacterium]|nr:serine/threonine protein kinase [Acidobacteriota bacterium]
MPQSISHYRIEGEIGRGGMGVVYRAVDTRLGRPVAIKVLPAEATTEADRHRRFVREAQ